MSFFAFSPCVWGEVVEFGGDVRYLATLIPAALPVESADCPPDGNTVVYHESWRVHCVNEVPIESKHGVVRRTSVIRSLVQSVKNNPVVIPKK